MFSAAPQLHGSGSGAGLGTTLHAVQALSTLHQVEGRSDPFEVQTLRMSCGEHLPFEDLRSGRDFLAGWACGASSEESK